MLTPLPSVGETAKAAQLLQWPMWIRFAISGAGFAVLLLTVIRVERFFGEFLDGQTLAERRRQVYSIMFFPIILGSVVNTLLALLAPVWLSIIYPATSAYVIMASFGAILRSPAAPTPLKHELSKGLIAVEIIQRRRP